MSGRVARKEEGEHTAAMIQPGHLTSLEVSGGTSMLLPREIEQQTHSLVLPVVLLVAQMTAYGSRRYCVAREERVQPSEQGALHIKGSSMLASPASMTRTDTEASSERRVATTRPVNFVGRSTLSSVGKTGQLTPPPSVSLACYQAKRTVPTRQR